eukprot:302801_1
MKDSEWSICINGKITDKQNAEKLKQVLQTIPPIPVVEIVKIESGRDGCVIIIHYGDKQFKYKITASIKDWKEHIYQNLFKAIRKEFNLESDFGLIDADPNKTQVHLFVQKHNKNRAKEALKSWFDGVDLNYLDPDIDKDELINAIGIKKKPHRKKILAEIHMLIKNNTQQNTDNNSYAKLDFKAKTIEPTTTIREDISDAPQSMDNPLIILLGITNYNNTNQDKLKPKNLYGIRTDINTYYKLWDEQFGYDIYPNINDSNWFKKENWTKNEISQFINAATKKLVNDKRYNGLIICLSGHGDNNNCIISSDGKYVNIIDDIQNKFKS